ncbi:MAG: dihydrodipicolinate synthase family protein [Sedimentisphaerales bacterium]|nr:dihydrodipicolinate synthase family protein [Sedimentisphaerales bacterium]
MVTPLLEADTLDPVGLERLVEHILAGGVHGLFILGTVGEAPALSHRARHDLVERVCAQVHRRVPVLVGLIDTSVIEALNLARQAAAAGADGLVLTAPYYYPASQADLLAYLRCVVPQLPLPVLLYNIPDRPAPVFDVETVKAASDMPNIVGLKDSSANMIYFRQLQSAMEDQPDFSLLMGPEMLLAEAVLLGAHGGVSGGANLLPRLYVDLYEAAHRRDIAQAQALHKTVMKLKATLFNVSRERSGFLRALKCALSCLGICSDFVAEPFRRFDEPNRQRVQQYLTELGITKNGLTRTT